jgi:hypothetical protein
MEASIYQKRKRSLLAQLLRVHVCNVNHGRFITEKSKAGDAAMLDRNTD